MQSVSLPKYLNKWIKLKCAFFYGFTKCVNCEAIESKEKAVGKVSQLTFTFLCLVVKQ